MALMLAPYNEAMRLGMGYTQQLCCNDVVRMPGGESATEGDLQETKQTPPPHRLLPSSGAESNILSTKKGTDIIVQKRIGVGNDNQNVVSQVVSWTAAFVDSVSEVTSKLHISGAVTVKVDALGSVKVAGHYIDDKAMKQADANYNITVKVTNQRLEAPRLTEFYPIEHIMASRFNEVYGDCFISGFLEGGLFSAAVAIKRLDDKKTKDMGGDIEVEAKVSGLDIKGQVKANYKTGNTEQNYTTTITVNWSGGGDIKPESIKEWDIKTLTQAAMDFPDKVAACPQKTYAILTKYTALRSFHESTVKGSPLDYENAGIYTNSLLDAYMDYKYIWSQIQERIAGVDKGLITVQKAVEHESLGSYRKAFCDNFKERMDSYTAAKNIVDKHPKKYGRVILEPPMPPNELVAYAADLFGLDRAKRDCRFEMIKIVREVNAVNDDPKVATDAARNWQYVAPSIFRRLVPWDKPIDIIPAAALNAIKNDFSNRIQDAAQDHQSEARSGREGFFQSGQPNCELEKRVNLKYGHLAEHWRIDSINGQSVTPPSAIPFNDLDVLDKTYVVTNITVWHDDQRLVGIQLLYQNGQILFHGVKDTSSKLASLNIDSGRRDKPESVNTISLEAHEDEAGKAWVDTIRVITTTDFLIVEPSDRLKYNNSFTLRAAKPRLGDSWDLKGFYGSFDSTKKAFAQLSPIWGRTMVDSPVPKAMPLFEITAWDSSIQNWPIAAIESLSNHVNKGDMFRLSHPRGSLHNSSGTLFNALDHIDGSWVISQARFYFNDAGEISVLSGVSVDYTNNKQLQHGKCGAGMLMQTWEPSKKKSERVVAVSTCYAERVGQSQCSLGLRLFFETEEETEEPKKDQATSDTKTRETQQVEDAAASKDPATASTKASTAAESAQPPPPKEKSAQPPSAKEKVIKKSNLWLSGPLGLREDKYWSSELASVSPSRDNPDETWTVKGFMGQAGKDGIETIAVIWGKN